MVRISFIGYMQMKSDNSIIRGIRDWKNPGNNFCVVKLHYSADPLKSGVEWLQSAKRGMSTNAWEREMEVNFSEGIGQGVFAKDFTQLHIAKLQYLPDRILHRGWDFGYRRPAVVFAQMDLKGHWMVLKSVLGKDVKITEFAEAIIQRTKEWFSDIQEIRDYGDPAGNQVKDTSEKTTVQVLNSYKIYPKTRRSSPTQRIEIIAKKLSTLIEGVPSLLVDINCRDIIDGFEGGYKYPETNSGKSVKDNPLDDGYYIHLFDALGYMADNLFSLQGTAKGSSRINRVIRAVNWRKRFK